MKFHELLEILEPRPSGRGPARNPPGYRGIHNERAVKPVIEQHPCVLVELAKPQPRGGRKSRRRHRQFAWKRA